MPKNSRAAGAAVVVADRELDAGRLRLLLAETVAPQRLDALRAAARRLQNHRPHCDHSRPD